MVYVVISEFHDAREAKHVTMIQAQQQTMGLVLAVQDDLSVMRMTPDAAQILMEMAYVAINQSHDVPIPMHVTTTPLLQ